jgi:type 1 glutamine amidotransferase
MKRYHPMQAIFILAITLACAGSVGEASAQTVATIQSLSPLVIPEEDLAPWAQPRTAAGPVLGWRIGVDLGDFASNLKAAVEITRPFGGFQGGVFVIPQAIRASLTIPRFVDSSLFPGELAEVRSLTDAVGYRVEAVPSDEVAARAMFDFAKGLKAEMIIVEHPSLDNSLINRLADQYQLKVALCGRAPALATSLASLGKQIGACIDTADFSSQGISPAQAIDALKDRLMVIDLRDHSRSAQRDNVAFGEGDVDFGSLFAALYAGKAKPLLLVRRSGTNTGSAVEIRRSLTYLNTALRPFIAQKVMELSRATPTKDPESLSADLRQPIEIGVAAIPKSAWVKAKRPRELLVIDLNVAYPGHKSIPAHNYALQKLATRTGQFRVVFSNNLDNLKFPKIKEFDAIFLNNTVGMIFADDEVRDSLVRYLREGGGLAGIHGASHASMDWPTFGEMLGGRGGAHREPTEKAWIQMDDPSSPLNAAFGGKPFEYQDEFFHFVEPPYDRAQIHVLLSVDVGLTDMAQGKVLGPFELGREDSDYAVSWIRNVGKGRIFYSILGHNPTLFANPKTAQHLLAAIQFVLGDLKADTAPSATHSPKPASQGTSEVNP